MAEECRDDYRGAQWTHQQQCSARYAAHP
jgi:hypothetical protein